MRNVSLEDLIQHSSLYVTGGCSAETASTIIRRLTPSEKHELQLRRPRLTKVVSLNLTHLGLNHATAYVQNCTSLAFLYLAYNAISDIGQVALPPSLLRLDLRHNRLIDLGNYYHWAFVPQLRVLHVDGNNLSISAFEALAPLTNLVVLTCTETPAVANPHFRHYIVNLLPSLQVFNNTIVSLAERVSWLHVPDAFLQRAAVNLLTTECCPLPKEAPSPPRLQECYARYCGIVYSSKSPIKEIVDRYAFDAYNVNILYTDMRTIAEAYNLACPVVIIQRVCKGFVVWLRYRAYLQQRTSAAVTIQAYQRMRSLRTIYRPIFKVNILGYQRAAVKLQRAYRAVASILQEERNKLHTEQMERAVAAITQFYRRRIKRDLRSFSFEMPQHKSDDLSVLQLYIARMNNSYANVVAIFEQLIQIILSELQVTIFAYTEAKPEEFNSQNIFQTTVFTTVPTDYQVLRVLPSNSLTHSTYFDMCIKKRNFKSFHDACSIVSKDDYSIPEDATLDKFLAKATQIATTSLTNSTYQRVMRSLETVTLPASTHQAHWNAADKTGMPYLLRFDFGVYSISSLFRYLLTEFQNVDFMTLYPENMKADIERSIYVGRTIATKYLSHSLYQELILLITTGQFSGNISIAAYRKQAKDQKSVIVMLTKNAVVQTAAACSIQSLFRMWRSNMMLTPLELFGRHIPEFNIPITKSMVQLEHERRDSTLSDASRNLAILTGIHKNASATPRSLSHLSVGPPLPAILEHAGTPDDSHRVNYALGSTLQLNASTSLPPSQDIDLSYHPAFSQVGSGDNPGGRDSEASSRPQHTATFQSTRSEDSSNSTAFVCMHTYPIIRLALRVSRAAQILQRNIRRIMARMRLLVSIKARSIFADIVRHGFFFLSRTVAMYLFDNCLLNPKSTRKLPHVTSYLGEHCYIILLPAMSEKFKMHVQQGDTTHSANLADKTEKDIAALNAAMKQRRTEVLKKKCDWSLSTHWIFRGYYATDVVVPMGLERDFPSLQTQSMSRSFGTPPNRARSALRKRPTGLNTRVLQSLNYNRIYGHPEIKQWGVVEVYSSRCYQHSILSAESLFQWYVRSFPPDVQESVANGTYEQEKTYKMHEFNFFALPMASGISKKNARTTSAQISRGLRSISSLASANDIDDSDEQLDMSLDCDPYRLFCNDSRLLYFPSNSDQSTAAANTERPYIRFNKKATIVDNLRVIYEGLVFSPPSKTLFSTPLLEDFHYVTEGLYCVTHRPGCSVPDLAFKAALLEMWFCDPFRCNYGTKSFSIMQKTFINSPGIVLTTNTVVITLAVLTMQRIMRGHLVRKYINLKKDIHALIELQDYVSNPIRNTFREKYAMQIIRSIASSTAAAGNYTKLPPLAQTRTPLMQTLGAAALPPTPQTTTPRERQHSSFYLQPAKIKNKFSLSYGADEIIREGQQVGVLPLVLRSNMHPADVIINIDSKTYPMEALETYIASGINPVSNEAQLTEAFYKATKELGQEILTRTNQIIVSGVRGATLGSVNGKRDTQKAALLLSELKYLTTKQPMPMPLHDKLRLKDYYRDRVFLPVHLYDFVEQKTALLDITSKDSTTGSATSHISQELESTSSVSSMVIGGTMKEISALNKEVERFSLEEDRLTDSPIPAGNTVHLMDSAFNEYETAIPKKLATPMRVPLPEIEEITIKTQLQRVLLERGGDTAKKQSTRQKQATVAAIASDTSKLKAEVDVRKMHQHAEQLQSKQAVEKTNIAARRRNAGKYFAGELVARMRSFEKSVHSKALIRSSSVAQ